MAGGNYSHTTRATGITLTAAIYNSDHVNHITNQSPEMTGGYSDTVGEMQTNTDPGGVGSESLSGSLAAELERLRFAIKRITGTAQWYVAPATDLAAAAAATVPPVTLAGASNPPLSLRRTENDTTARDIFKLGSGSGAGNQAIRQVVGSGSNAVASLRDFIGATELHRISATEFLHLIALQVGVVGTPRIILDPAGFVDLIEITAPANPAADNNRLYSVDDGGATVLAFRDSAGVVTGLRIASQADMEAATSLLRTIAPGRQHFHPGHPKAGGNFDGTGTPAFRSGDYGMGSITDNGVGDYTLALDTAFSNTNYWATGWARGTSGTQICTLSGVVGGTKTSSSFQIETVTSGVVDTPEGGISFWGDYA